MCLVRTQLQPAPQGAWEHPQHCREHSQFKLGERDNVVTYGIFRFFKNFGLCYPCVACVGFLVVGIQELCGFSVLVVHKPRARGLQCCTDRSQLHCGSEHSTDGQILRKTILWRTEAAVHHCSQTHYSWNVYIG